MKVDNRYSWVKKPRTYSPLVDVHFLNVRLLSTYLSDVNKIQHRFFTKLSRKWQDRICREIKVARQMGLLPFKM